GHECVEDARVLAPAGVRAQRLVQHERVAVRQLARVYEPDRAQVAGHCRPDVGQLLEGVALGGACRLARLDARAEGHGRADRRHHVVHCRLGRNAIGRVHISIWLRTSPTATPSSSKSTSPNGTTMVLKSGFSAISSIVLRVRRKRLTVTSSPRRATTI